MKDKPKSIHFYQILWTVGVLGLGPTLWKRSSRTIYWSTAWPVCYCEMPDYELSIITAAAAWKLISLGLKQGITTDTSWLCKPLHCSSISTSWSSWSSFHNPLTFLLFNNDLASHDKDKLRDTDIINCTEDTRVGVGRHWAVLQDEQIRYYPERMESLAQNLLCLSKS